LGCSDNRLVSLEGLPIGLERLLCYDNQQLKYIEPSPAKLKFHVPEHLKEKYPVYSDLRKSYLKHKALKRNFLSFLALANMGLPTLETLGRYLELHFKASF
jgi:hypothetical protein